MTPSDIFNQTSPKRMRKGTRSCIECRRRKVRCVSTKNQPACDHCISRKTDCFDQEGHPFTLEDSLASTTTSGTHESNDLRSLVGQLLQRLDQTSAASNRSGSRVSGESPLQVLQSELLPSTAEAADVGTDVFLTPSTFEGSDATDQASSRAPALSLFDIAVLSQGNDNHVVSDILPIENQRRQLLEKKSKRVIYALTVLTAQVDYLHLALEASPDCWKIWSKAFPEFSDTKFQGLTKAQQTASIVRMVHSTLAEANLPDVTKVALHLALSLQQIPGHFDSSNMRQPISLEALQDQYLTSAETLIALDEGFACSLDGLGCMMAQANYYVDVGKPRKAWMTFRRAVGFSQLLGLHRQLKPAAIMEQERIQQQSRSALWQRLCFFEKCISLTLGLPSSIPPYQVPQPNVTTETLEGPYGEQLMQSLSTIITKLIDRNQNSDKMDFPTTAKLDQDLEDIKKKVPPDWWDASPTRCISKDALHDMFIAKFWYNNVRRLLHLPFMLKCPSEPRYRYSSIAAIESSREMIKAFRVLRDEKRPVLHCCDVIDYIAFTAAMSLIISLIDNPQQILATQDDAMQQGQDWELIHLFRDDMKRFSEERPCSVATQTVLLLDDFLRVHFEGWPIFGDEKYHVVIPYFGKVQVGQSMCSSNSQVIPFHLRHNYQTPYATPSDIPREFSGTINGFEAQGQPYMEFESFLQPLPGGEQLQWEQVMGGMDWSAAGTDFEDDLRGNWGWVLDQ